MKTNKVGVYVHGEAFFFPSSIPNGAKKREIKSSDKYVIVADSETTGNHHVVDLNGCVDVYDEGDKMFITATKDTTIRCLHADRHDTISIPAGTYEFGTQQEYDPFTERLNKVRD